ncbi:UDP-N-acetylmuramoyl-tripeptide--D-alanyl-D-alanine ligase [Hazenella sp. IB182353]|nr:UDP-N-acetylmuramoyl-tripeptide--D-alanyl-D-alanine ligase [Polycladospora coralii]
MMIERTARWLARESNGELIADPADRYRMVRGVSTDTRTLQINNVYVPLVGEHFDGHDFVEQAIEKGAAAILWQEHYPLPSTCELPIIRVQDTLRALQMIATSYRQELDASIVAITGSNGKTTTKDLTASILERQYRVHKTAGNLNNHIGVPLTLLSMPEDTEIGIIEMGMNHAGEIGLLSKMAHPNIAVITNIGESHIEFLGSREGIAKAKLEILEGLAEDGVFICDGDEPLLTPAKPHIRVGYQAECEDSPLHIESKGSEGFTFQSKQTGTHFVLPLLGRHNLKNALLAIAVGRQYQITEAELRDRLMRVQLSGMRLELKTARNGMAIINDAYNASPTSMRAALDLLAEIHPNKEKWALLGDINEIGDQSEYYHREIGEYVVGKGINKLYTIGPMGEWIHAGAEEAGISPLHFASKEEAISILDRDGDANVVLLVKASRSLSLEIIVKRLVEGEQGKNNG